MSQLSGPHVKCPGRHNLQLGGHNRSHRTERVLGVKMAGPDKLRSRTLCCEVRLFFRDFADYRVNGTLPEEVRDELERRGIPYRPRDGSSREIDS